MPPALLRVGFGAALLASFMLALAPSPDLPGDFEHTDKLGHVLAYTALGVLGLLAYPRHTLAVCALLLTHGAAVEFAQSLTEHRHGDILDWLADAAGVWLALIGRRALDTLRRVRNRP